MVLFLYPVLEHSIRARVVLSIKTILLFHVCLCCMLRLYIWLDQLGQLLHDTTVLKSQLGYTTKLITLTNSISGGSRNLERGVQSPARFAHRKIFGVATPTFGHVNAFIAGRQNLGVRHKRNLVHCPTVLF